MHAQLAGIALVVGPRGGIASAATTTLVGGYEIGLASYGRDRAWPARRDRTGPTMPARFEVVSSNSILNNFWLNISIQFKFGVIFELIELCAALPDPSLQMRGESVSP